MRKNNFPPHLQAVIREYFRAQPRGIYTELARNLGLTQRAISYNLTPESSRPMTWDFLGRLAFSRPDDWKAIMEEHTGGPRWTIEPGSTKDPLITL